MTDSYTVSTLKFSVINIIIILHFFRLIVSPISIESMWTLAVVTITTLFSTNCRVCVYICAVISFTIETTIVVTGQEQLKNKVALVWPASKQKRRRKSLRHHPTREYSYVYMY